MLADNHRKQIGAVELAVVVVVDNDSSEEVLVWALAVEPCCRVTRRDRAPGWGTAESPAAESVEIVASHLRAAEEQAHRDL